MNKINVLCLHGCCQNAQMFQSILKSLIKKGKHIQFHFLQGPFEHPDGGITWTDPPLKVEDIWHDKEGTGRSDFSSAVPGVSYNDSILEKSFSMIHEYIQTYNITVLLGFSQGSFVCYEYMRKFRDIKIVKIIAMSGYTFDKEIYPPLDLNILNVFHPMDNVVPMALAYSNGDKTISISHNNKELTTPSKEGHKCPNRAAHIRSILEFISST